MDVDARFGWRPVNVNPTQEVSRSLLGRLIARGARMFRSKTIGWITALTLLCVAGVALACRLKDGNGPAVQAVAANWTTNDKDVPAPLPAPPTPPSLPNQPSRRCCPR